MTKISLNSFKYIFCRAMSELYIRNLFHESYKMRWTCYLLLHFQRIQVVFVTHIFHDYALYQEALNETENICKWSFIVFSFCLIHSINLTYSTDLFRGNNAVFVEMYKAQIKFPAIIVIYVYIANIYKYITHKYHQKLHSFNAVFGYILNNDIDFFV